MQIWDFFNALLRFASPSLCSTSASSAEFPNSAERKSGICNSHLELRSLATEGTQEFPPLNFHLRALSIMNYEL